MSTKRIPKKPEVLSAWIQFHLKLNRSSCAKVGRKLGISREAVRKALPNPSERVADVLAAEIGFKKHKIWPERYAA